MKKRFVFLILLLTAAFSASHALDVGSSHNQMVSSIASPVELASTINLTEDQANNDDAPIVVNLGNKVIVGLLGEDTFSRVYSSGSGSNWGYRWDCDGSDNDVLVSKRILPRCPENIRILEPGTYSHSYLWAFRANKTGTSIVTFKKYYYSNATICNLDGTSPWKDPIEEIHFTINVVDPAQE